ncbi:hypothetical protein DQM68_07060 [Leptospira mayottensis]|uniref:Uncharacterized protein n=1 Tax=Leptospira mayottensis TaxID=1137606 RepID=A0ABN5NWV8_9LEPT|nr:hypothetical protein DQM68_07060 [Leptospira mayottensis]AXR64296.1 hypothetical protein DQM28_08755 [Leptospira mayottensis]AXR68007.1 hypothetical protein DPV73_08225 [Leptospira mayottensis]AZQ03085.1 hypothetical protein LEP1GSC190_14630 [Leptospira mayottensis 200901116]
MTFKRKFFGKYKSTFVFKRAKKGKETRVFIQERIRLQLFGNTKQDCISIFRDKVESFSDRL